MEIEELKYGINYGKCWACHLENLEDYVDYKLLAFYDDESEYGYCAKHIIKALEIILEKLKNG